MWTRTLTVGLLLIASCAVIHGQDFDRRDRRDRGDRGDRERGDRAGRGGFDRDRGDRGGFGGDRGRSGRGGPGGFDPVGRMDANQNGRIDQEEIDRIPERFREMMKARGFEVNAGESVDDVRERTRRRFEEELRRRESERDSEDGSSGRDNRSTPPPVFRPRERQRMTLDLPDDYADVDTDLDGQIGLYEWIVARRDQLELFDDMDRDSDGLLTPRELAAWKRANDKSGQESTTAAKREKLLIVGSTASGPSPPPSTQSDDGRRSRSERRDDGERERSFDRSTSRRRRWERD